jgi:hypothetical protein
LVLQQNGGAAITKESGVSVLLIGEWQRQWLLRSGNDEQKAMAEFSPVYDTGDVANSAVDTSVHANDAYCADARATKRVRRD